MTVLHHASAIATAEVADAILQSVSDQERYVLLSPHNHYQKNTNPIGL